jgi:hypothetical protein
MSNTKGAIVMARLWWWLLTLVMVGELSVMPPRSHSPFQAALRIVLVALLQQW